MPLTDYPTIQSIIDGDYDFRFGEYISSGFDVFKMHLGPFVAFTLVYFVISGITGVIPFVGQIVNLFLAPILVVGYYLVANKVQNGKTPEFGEFFEGFKFLTPIAMRVIASTGIFIICALPFIYFTYDSGLLEWYWKLVTDQSYAPYAMDDFPGFSPASFFLLLPVIYFGIAYMFADMFIVFKGMNFWDAMEASRQLVTKKWFTFFGFTIFLGLIAMGGFIAFCIGIIFAIPAIMCMTYVAFADITKLNENFDNESDILDHLVKD